MDKKIKKIIVTAFYSVVIILVGYLRLAFPGKTLIENDAVLYTEIVKIFNGINPFPQFTFKWTPLFLTGYYGWFLSDLRVLVYYFLPFLKVQFYLTALFGIAVIFSIYRLSMRLYGQRNIAILSSFLISIIPIHVSMSYGLSPEIPSTFFFIESFNFLSDFIKRQKRRDFLISGALFAFSVLSKPISILLIPGICCLIFINRDYLKTNIVKFILFYFALPFIIWLSWAIPNFYRIFGTHFHSFLSFGFKIGSESMKIGLIEAHLQFLSVIGIILSGFSFLCLLALHKREDLFIAFSIASSLLILYSLKDVMTYWYPFIVPFYCIAIARVFFSVKLRVVKAVVFLFLIYFIAICIRSDIINLDFDFSSQSGICMKSNTKNMVFELVQGQKNLDIIERIREIIKDNDVVFLSNTFGSYKGLLIDIDTRMLPNYASIKQGVIKYKKDWIKEVNDMMRNSLGAGKGRVLLILQDGGYYYRVFDKGVWFETHQDQMLEEAGFKKIYETKYPDKEAIDKSRRYYRNCSLENWAKNYIFEKEFN